MKTIMPTNKWGIWAVRSGRSVFSLNSGWVRRYSQPVLFDTEFEAVSTATRYNRNVGTLNIFYKAKPYPNT